jgi:hypothetical protein
MLSLGDRFARYVYKRSQPRTRALLSLTLFLLLAFGVTLLLPKVWPGALLPFDSTLPFHTTLPPGMRSCRLRPTDSVSSFKQAPPLVVVAAVTPSFLQHPGYANFLLASQLQNISVHTLHFVLPPHTSDSQTWLVRLHAFVQYVQTLPSKTVVAIIDPVDSLVLGPPDEFLRSYHSFGTPVVFAAERLCDSWHCKSHMLHREMARKRAPSLSNPYMFLNAGHMVGTASELLFIFGKAIRFIRENEVDDQAAFVFLWEKHPSIISLDYDSLLFGIFPPTTIMMTDWKVGSGDVLVARNNHSPTFVHFPGMRYENKESQMLNPCQTFLRNQYNRIGSRLFNAALDPNARRVVLSLTTTPVRLPFLEQVLKSILAQTHPLDAIYLNIPYFTKRFNTSYEIPQYVKDLSRITILRGEDYGPITKIIPVLFVEKDPRTLIITVDDEYRYPLQFVEELVTRFNRWPYAVYGYAGQMIEMERRSRHGVAVRSADKSEYKSSPHGVDILEAFLGALYMREYFDLGSLLPVDDVCFTTDDIWISRHLELRGIPRIKLPIAEGQHPVQLGHDVLSPLRTLNIDGQRNLLCAGKYVRDFQSGWLRTPSEPCSTAFTEFSLGTPLTTSAFDSFWNANNTHSPCNPQAQVFHNLLPMQHVYSSNLISSWPVGSIAVLHPNGDFVVSALVGSQLSKLWKIHVKNSHGDIAYFYFDHLGKLHICIGVTDNLVDISARITGSNWRFQGMPVKSISLESHGKFLLKY